MMSVAEKFSGDGKGVRNRKKKLEIPGLKQRGTIKIRQSFLHGDFRPEHELLLHKITVIRLRPTFFCSFLLYFYVAVVTEESWKSTGSEKRRKQ